MSTGAKIGYGTLLKAGNGASPEVFTTIAEVIEIDPPGESAELVEATNQDSASSRKEYIGGLVDGVELSGSANLLIDTTQLALRTDLINKTTRNFQCVVPVSPSNKTASFSAVILKWQPRAPIAGRMILEFSLKVSGVVTWA